MTPALERLVICLLEDLLMFILDPCFQGRGYIGVLKRFYCFIEIVLELAIAARTILQDNESFYDIPSALGHIYTSKWTPY